jgi:hypothetical protein
MLKELINAAFVSGQAHEYSLNEEGNLTGFGQEVVVRGDWYIVNTSDCSSCDGAHVNCKEVEFVTTYPDEALLNLELANGVGK